MDAQELQHARILADKLVSQCRDSTTYRPLCSNLRRLRNVIEDIEDSFHDGGTIGTNGASVLLRVSHSRIILGQLDLALQQSPTTPGQTESSGQSDMAVNIFRTLLDDTSDKLDSSFHALTAAPATNPAPGTSPNLPSPSLNDVAVQTSKLSPTNSSWSLVSDSQASNQDIATPPDPARKPSGEATTNPATQTCSASANSYRKDSARIQGPFGFYVDPLSTPIELATSLILSDEPDDLPQARGMNLRSAGEGLNGGAPSGGPSSSEHVAIVDAPPAQQEQYDNEKEVYLGEETVIASAESERRQSSASFIPIVYVNDLVPATGLDMHDHSRQGSLIPIETLARPRSESAPPLPQRPPPLPPRPRRHRKSTSVAHTSAKSKYRIVNADPEGSATSRSSISEDEVLVVAPPSSPEISRPPVPPKRLPITDAPLIVIDSSALSPSDESKNLSPTPGRSSFEAPLSRSAAERLNDRFPKIPGRAADEPLQARNRYRRPRQPSTHAPEVIPSGDPITESYPQPDTPSQRFFKQRSANVTSARSSATTLGTVPTRPDQIHRRNRSQSDLDNTSTRSIVSSLSDDSLSNTVIAQRPRTEVFEFYGKTPLPSDMALDVDLDRERVSHIVDCWNRGAWVQAEQYLLAHLEVLVEAGDRLAARRTRHLLGVCASLKGELAKAIEHLLPVLRAPVRDVRDLDVGDCAAAYWLGDAYAMCNRRAEALLAYSIAERSPLYQDANNARLRHCIWAERRSCLPGVSRADFAQYRQQGPMRDGAPPSSSLLDANTVSPDVVRALLDIDMRDNVGSPKLEPTFELDPQNARAKTLSRLHVEPSDGENNPGRYYGIKISGDMLYPHSFWPMAYDPFFAMANVSPGRMLTAECDILNVFRNNRQARVSKSGPLGMSRVDCFNYHDLDSLVEWIRSCFVMLGMGWGEVYDAEKTCFFARYGFLEPSTQISTPQYFSVSIFRSSIRSGFGVEVCPEGVTSARVMRTDPSYDRGVQPGEAKRIRKIFRDYLEEQARQRGKDKRPISWMPTKSNTRSMPSTPDIRSQGEFPQDKKDAYTYG